MPAHADHHPSYSECRCIASPEPVCGNKTFAPQRTPSKPLAPGSPGRESSTATTEALSAQAADRTHSFAGTSARPGPAEGPLCRGYHSRCEASSQVTLKPESPPGVPAVPLGPNPADGKGREGATTRTGSLPDDDIALN